MNKCIVLSAQAHPVGKDIHHMDMVKPIFTLQDNEVLYWSSMGKTYGEIAAIAGISVSTVKFHMGNIVSKLGVSNARQAIPAECRAGTYHTI
ncbi:helix-turn-helix transcriptional regulator [Serratia symbiotica]|nr:helix-turn-helix transcriptional regulator [Serratia symbiotica]